MRLLLSCVDIDECFKDPCENGGNCTDGINHYNCACRDGFTDKLFNKYMLHFQGQYCYSVELAFITLDFKIVVKLYMKKRALIECIDSTAF